MTEGPHDQSRRTPLPPVSCLTRNIPRPSPSPRFPMTDFGLGNRAPRRGPSCILVGLDANCLVGLSPPPVICRISAASELLPTPVYCRAMVVAPVNCRPMVVLPVCCAATPPKGPRPPVYEGTTGDLTGDGVCRNAAGSSNKHSLHQTLPSLSVFAALSSFLPQPGFPTSLRFPLASFPPQVRQPMCHRVPWGPGTTPLSITDTACPHPGHADDPPKRVCTGNVVVIGGAVGGGLS